MIRLGLCCKFNEEPIRFRTTTVKALSVLEKDNRLLKLNGIVLHNADALFEALIFCKDHGIGSFRVNSQILPIKTHSEFGYDINDLPSGADIIRRFKQCRSFSAEHNLRLTFHPDQFVVLNPQDPGIFDRSLEELKYQTQVAQWIGADVVNLHAGGGYGDKKESLKRLEKNIKKMPSAVLKRLTLENDDRTYTPQDLLPVCRELGIPFVYDVHHHRCLPDQMTLEEATDEAIKTWNREPLFHLSSPCGRENRQICHHDYIQKEDFPEYWKTLTVDFTVEIEAKAKETAIERLRRELNL